MIGDRDGRPWGILLVEVLHSGRRIDPPMWLTVYDPDDDEPGAYPTGKIEASADPAKALRFTRPQEAAELYLRASTITPLIPRTQHVNRPLAAMKIEISRLPGDGDGKERGERA